MNLRRLKYKAPPILVDRPHRFIWEMKDGTKVYSNEMSNSHIYNCVQLLESRMEQVLNEPSELIAYTTSQIEKMEKSWNALIDKFKQEIIWRRQNKTYINKTHVRRPGQMPF